MSRICPTSGPSEAESFQLEMSGLLSELACPYSVLIIGDLTQRFLNKDACLLLLSTTLHTFKRSQRAISVLLNLKQQIIIYIFRSAKYMKFVIGLIQVTSELLYIVFTHLPHVTGYSFIIIKSFQVRVFRSSTLYRRFTFWEK